MPYRPGCSFEIEENKMILVFDVAAECDFHVQVIDRDVNAGKNMAMLFWRQLKQLPREFTASYNRNQATVDENLANLSRESEQHRLLLLCVGLVMHLLFTTRQATKRSRSCIPLSYLSLPHHIKSFGLRPPNPLIDSPILKLWNAPSNCMGRIRRRRDCKDSAQVSLPVLWQ